MKNHRILVLVLALITLGLFQTSSVTAQMTPEEEQMLREYGATDEYFEMQRKMDEIVRHQEDARHREKTIRLIIVLLSLAVAVVPLAATCKNIIRHPELRTGKGIAAAIGVSLLGGAVLFAFNYGWMYMRFKHGDALNVPLAILITLAIAVGALYVLNKKDPKDEKES